MLTFIYCRVNAVMIKPFKKLINAKRTSTKLRILADKIEKYKDFDQTQNDNCVVGYGGRLHGEKGYGNTSHGFARHFGVTGDDAWFLLMAEYQMLDIGERSMRGRMYLVTAEYAANILRKLAARYAREGN